ncbi:hypothetical protein GGR90_002755 [Sphingopyxis italica]|uniref:Uncharacterized protein n=1 Tax=Sphingopyxis italica TaxID=1129133 RepID=A0A7X5XUP1_9SPHN|nr:hypothetical protein [Sphingopyxis italica]NJB90561.1 hypothetical protein [Sphingopyxis italica]
MSGPPDDEMPSTGVATGLGIDVEWTAISGSGADDTSGEADAPEVSNVVPFRPFLRGQPHPFELVEIFPIEKYGQNLLLLSVAGPWTASPHEGGERKPWQWMATYPLADAAVVVQRAEALSANMGIPIADLAGVTSSPHPLAEKYGPEAAA